MVTKSDGRRNEILIKMIALRTKSLRLKAMNL